MVLSLEVKISPVLSDDIIIYRGDDINKIVTTFVKKHNLSEGKLQKLTRLIRENINDE